MVLYSSCQDNTHIQLKYVARCGAHQIPCPLGLPVPWPVLHHHTCQSVACRLLSCTSAQASPAFPSPYNTSRASQPGNSAIGSAAHLALRSLSCLHLMVLGGEEPAMLVILCAAGSCVHANTILASCHSCASGRVHVETVRSCSRNHVGFWMPCQVQQLAGIVCPLLCWVSCTLACTILAYRKPVGLHRGWECVYG